MIGVMVESGQKGPEADDAVFAENMTALRTTFGISQQELVRRLNELGWSSAYQTTISRIEKGERPVRIGEAKLIARALGVDLARMTMSSRDGRLARQLSAGREGLLEAERAIHRGTSNWLQAQRKLELLIDDTRRLGVVPSEIPPQPEDDPINEKLITPVTLEDELAAAIAATERTLELVLEMGKIRGDLDEGRRRYDELLRREGRDAADDDLRRRLDEQHDNGAGIDAEA